MATNEEITRFANKQYITNIISHSENIAQLWYPIIHV